MLVRLRRLRKLHGLSLRDVAAEVGISYGYLSRIERGFITRIEDPAKQRRLEEYLALLERRIRLGDAEHHPALALIRERLVQRPGDVIVVGYLQDEPGTRGGRNLKLRVCYPEGSSGDADQLMKELERSLRLPERRWAAVDCSIYPKTPE